jgi:hypothetical protein
MEKTKNLVRKLFFVIILYKYNQHICIDTHSGFSKFVRQNGIEKNKNSFISRSGENISNGISDFYGRPPFHNYHEKYNEG